MWFADHGLPQIGQTVPDLDRRMPTSRHFEADGPSEWGKTSWSLRKGQFVGVSWFFWSEAEESRTAAAAESLRTLFDDAWARVDSFEHPVQGSMTLWKPGKYQVGLYLHAPRQIPAHDSPGRGCVQLHVDHALRAADEETDANQHASEAPPDHLAT